MIKELKKYQIKLTPFTTAKNWSLDNIGNEDLIMTEDDYSLALEFVDFGGLDDVPTLNTSCSLALEQQEADAVHYREGLKLSGIFYPDQDPANVDGTYKRVVYAQVKTTFYNEYRDPTKMWGLDEIDFEIAGTKKYLADSIKLFDIPQLIFGEKIVENSVELFDNTLDDLFTITDDGQGNLIASKNLFSRYQEVESFTNTFLAGNNPLCDDYLNFNAPGSSSLTASLMNSTPYVALNWTDAENETGYTLERSVNSGSTYSVLTYPGKNVLTYNDTVVTIGSIYWYRVYAFNAFGTSSYSNTASVWVWNPPLAPTNLSASIIDLTGSFLTWDDNSSNEDGFFVQRAPSTSSAFVTIQTLGADVTGTLDLTTTIGNIYTFRVCAYNVYDSSSFSNSVTLSLVVPAPVILTQPQNVTASVSTSISFSVSASGDTLTYQWQSGSSNLSDNTRLTGSNSASLTINSIAIADTGSGYRVIASNPGGSVTSNYAYLQVIDPFLYDLTGSAFTLGQYDTFAEYPAGTAPTNKGIGWPAGSEWQMITRSTKVIAADDVFLKYSTIFSYTAGSAVSGSDTGYGWAGPWNVIEGQ